MVQVSNTPGTRLVGVLQTTAWFAGWLPPSPSVTFQTLLVSVVPDVSEPEVVSVPYCEEGDLLFPFDAEEPQPVRMRIGTKTRGSRLTNSKCLELNMGKIYHAVDFLPIPKAL